jgi:hypothetical protein
MLNYPLYEELLKQVNEKKDQTLNVQDLCLTINNISQLPINDQTDHYEEIYALMLHHENINNNFLSHYIVNDGKLMPGNKNILYVHSKLTFKLMQIISQYIDYYKKI